MKKIIAQIPDQNLEIIQQAADLENRPRNNFVLTAALEKARLLISKTETTPHATPPTA